MKAKKTTGEEKMRKKIPKILILLLSTSVLCQATTFTEDGVINGGTYGDVTIESTATVDMTAGTVESMLVTQLGTLNFYGGIIEDEIYLRDSGTFNLEGASFQGTQGMCMYDASTFNLNNGTFTGTMDLSDYVNVNLNGGQIVDGQLFSNYYAVTNIYDCDTAWDTVWLDHFSILNIHSGSVNWAESVGISNSATLNIYGGEVTFEHGFNLQGDAEINVYYSSIIYHEHDPFIVGYRLLDGREFMLDQFTQSEIEQITFVPEPATFLLLGLGGLLLRKRK